MHAHEKRRFESKLYSIASLQVCPISKIGSGDDDIVGEALPVVLLSDALDDNTQNSQQSRDPVVGSSANLQDEDSVGIDGYVYEFTRGSGGEGGGGGGGNLLTNKGFLSLGRLVIAFSLECYIKISDLFAKRSRSVHETCSFSNVNNAQL